MEGKGEVIRHARIRYLLLFAAAGLLFALTAAPAGAAVFTPTRLDDPPPNGCLPNDCSVREAVIDSEIFPGPDVVVLSPGTYALTRAATATEPEVLAGGAQNGAVGDLDITSSVTIFGGGTAVTAIDANDIDRVIDIDTGASVFLSFLTIRNGTAKQGFKFHNHGGGIHNHGDLTLEKVALSANVSMGIPWGGGGLTNAGGATARLENVTFAQNTTQYFGGGIENGGGLRLFNVTLGLNSAPAGQGGGLSNAVGFFAGGTARLNNTILADNAGGNCAGPVTSVGHNLSDDMTCAGLTATGDQQNVDPALIPIFDIMGFIYIFALPSGSPAVDAGSGPYDPATDVGCPDRDQRGISRPRDGDRDGVAVCDIGAYELSSSQPARR